MFKDKFDPEELRRAALLVPKFDQFLSALTELWADAGILGRLMILDEMLKDIPMLIGDNKSIGMNDVSKLLATLRAGFTSLGLSMVIQSCADRVNAEAGEKKQ